MEPGTRMLRGAFLPPLLLLLALATPRLGDSQVSPGQAGSGRLSGMVVDATTGFGVPGATIRAGPGVAGMVQSGSGGKWDLASVATGPHTLTISHPGFATEEVSVQVGQGANEIRTALTPVPIRLDALVVTSGRRLERLADVAVATDVVTRREIEDIGAPDLAGLLTRRAGFELQGGHPVGAGVMLQGLGSERVLVLVDGQPYVGRIAGQLDLSRIPTDIIERVEVVKGPLSTLYGSEAMGGVVNVITRRPDVAPWATSSRIVAGGQGRLDLSGGLSGSAGPAAGRVDLGRRSISQVPGQPGARGQSAERWDANTTVLWTPAESGLSIEAGLLLLSERQSWASGQLNQFADNTQQNGRVRASWETGPHRLTSTVVASTFEHLSRRSVTEEPVPGTGDEETQGLREVELLYGGGFLGQSLDAGLELQSERIVSDRVLGDRKTNRRTEAFVQSTLSLGRLTVVPGLRATTSDPWGDHWTPRLAAMFRPRPDLAFRLSGGEGFRVPAFKELYLEFLNIGPGFGYTVRGNPDLRPEVSRNLTAGFEWTGTRLYTSIQLFHNSFESFIETQAVGDSSGVAVYTYGNLDDGVTEGAEIEAAVTHRGWRLDLTYARLKARREGSGDPLLGRPAHSASAMIRYVRPGGTRISLNGTYTGRTPMRRSEIGTEWRSPFLRFGATLAQEIAGDLQLVFGVDNILDETEEEWPGFTGRHMYTGITWQPSGPDS